VLTRVNPERVFDPALPGNRDAWAQLETKKGVDQSASRRII
jgi:hypothetical protein